MTCGSLVSRRLSKLGVLLEESLPQGKGRGIITGPSHAVRWRYAIENGFLPPPFQETHTLGEGGFPVWNRTIFTQLFRSHQVGMPIFLVIPDFRFGNSLSEQPGVVSGQFYSDHTHIKRHLIRPDIDAMLYRHHVENLMIWRTVFGRDLKMFDWSMLMTASEHRWTNRYVDGGRYDNRSYWEWVHSDRARLGALSWPVRMLETDNARLRRLTVDRALHPSGIGFFMLHHMTQGMSFMQALESAEGLWARWVAELAGLLREDLGQAEPIALHGDSIWFETALRLLGGEDIAVLNEIGLFLPDDSSDTGEPSVRCPEGALHVRVTDSVDICDPGTGSASRPLVLQWGVLARDVISRRHPDNAHLAVPDMERIAASSPRTCTGQPWLSQMLGCTRLEAFVDAGANMAPTFNGMAMLLLSIVDCLGDKQRLSRTL